MISVSDQNHSPTPSGTIHSIPKPNLIRPRKYLIIVFNKAVQIVLHRVWWIYKNKISRTGTVYGHLEISAFYLNTTKRPGESQKIVSWKNNRRFRSDRHVKFVLFINSIQPIPTRSIQINQPSGSTDFVRRLLSTHLIIIFFRMPRLMLLQKLSDFPRIVPNRAIRDD